MFKGTGAIKNIRMPMNNRNGKETTKGFAFIEYRTHKDAEAVIAKLNGTKLHGRVIAVDWALRKNQYEENVGGIKKEESEDEEVTIKEEEESEEEVKIKEEEMSEEESEGESEEESDEEEGGERELVLSDDEDEEEEEEESEEETISERKKKKEEGKSFQGERCNHLV